MRTFGTGSRLELKQVRLCLVPRRTPCIKRTVSILDTSSVLIDKLRIREFPKSRGFVARECLLIETPSRGMGIETENNGMLKLSRSAVERVAVLAPSGRIDQEHVSELRNALMAELANCPSYILEWIKQEKTGCEL